MAYMIYDPSPHGPYPSKAGEYCGNYLKGYCISYYDLSKVRFGRPHSTKTKTVEEMEAAGYVGLYLKEDRQLVESLGEVECPAPPELLEPTYQK